MKLLFYLITIIHVLANYVSGAADRIAGGQPVNKGDYPFFVQIFVGILVNNETEMNRCGGSLVHPQWILTAAHCFKSTNDPSSIMFDSDKVLACMGSEQVAINSHDPGFVVRYIGDAHYHPHYTYREIGHSHEIENDVAVAKLKKGFQIDNLIKTIELPASYISLCRHGTIIGAGAISFNLYLNHVLKYSPVNSKTMFEISTRPFKARSAVFYSEIKWYQGHALQGDSGGPFICSENRDPVQHGIISAYYNTTMQSVITIYESVQKHMWFIRKFVPIEFSHTEWHSKKESETKDEHSIRHFKQVATSSSANRHISIIFLCGICMLFKIT